jgi:hypothetical protein
VEHDTTRIAEIINLLVKYGADLEGDYNFLKAAWKNAAQPQYGYTISCLPPLGDRYRGPLVGAGRHFPHVDRDPDRQLKISLAITSRNAMKDALESNERPENWNVEKWKPDHVAFLRQFAGENSGFEILRPVHKALWGNRKPPRP